MPGTQDRSIHKLSAPRLFGIISSLSKRNKIPYERRASRSSDTASWLRPFPQDGETFFASMHPDTRKLICVAYEQFMLPCVGPEGRYAINWLPYRMLSGDWSSGTLYEERTNSGSSRARLSKRPIT